MESVGELEEISGEKEVVCKSFEWRIKEFLSLPSEIDTFYYSPVFSFAGVSWSLKIYPNGQRETTASDGKTINSIGYIDLYLHRKSSGAPIYLEYSFGFKTVEEKEDSELHCKHNFEQTHGHGFYKLIIRPELLKRKSELVPLGVLTVVCKIRYSKTADISSETATKKCSYCKSTFDADEDLSSHQQKCMDKPIKCPECSDVVALKDWYHHNCQKTGAEAFEKLSHDLKTAMLSGDHSDVVVNVKGEKFRLHRIVLASRNSYFDSMFKADMKEKSSGVVTIEDCMPDTFRSFIHFIYTGKVDIFSTGNVFDLYEASDKYQEDQLKYECLNFMMNTLSVDSFCDYFALALRHDEKELFQKGVEFFIHEGKEIARSVKWQTFMREYPTEANELFIKTLDIALGK